jgi:ParB-like chromosome segregation protein Spo0J
MKKPDPAAEIAVHCAHAAIADWSTLRPHPKNPNRHPETQIALLAKNIRSLGWRHPVIVSKLSGYIVAGHARIEAAKLLNINAVPVDYQPFANTEEETAYLIADNRIAELAERDNAVLKDLLEELDTGATDMDLTGYVESEIERLMLQEHQDEEPEAIKPPRASIAFPARVWLTQRAEIMAAFQPIIEGFGGVAEWPE